MIFLKMGYRQISGLIGATTRTPSEIPPAIRSRCMEVFFRDLTQEEIFSVAKNAADKVNLAIKETGLNTLSNYARNGTGSCQYDSNCCGVSDY